MGNQVLETVRPTGEGQIYAACPYSVEGLLLQLEPMMFKLQWSKLTAASRPALYNYINIL